MDFLATHFYRIIKEIFRKQLDVIGLLIGLIWGIFYAIFWTPLLVIFGKKRVAEKK